MENEDNGLYSFIVDYFTRNKIKIPNDVLEALEEALNENDFDESIDDIINIYFLENLEELLNDLTLKNDIKIVVGAESFGDIKSVYSYYGTAEISFSESIGLYEPNLLLVESISENLSEFKTKLSNPQDWLVVVVETIQFSDGEYERIPRLHIYCPMNGKDIE